MTQLGLQLDVKRKATIAERFAEWIADHPEVYAELRRLALEAVRAGRRKIGIKELYEVARWHLRLKAHDFGRDGKSYALNNDYTAPMARLLMEREPELAGMFEIRERRSK